MSTTQAAQVTHGAVAAGEAGAKVTALLHVPQASNQLLHPSTSTGSARAADGSEISWTTAADGTITATGGGHKMTISGVPGSAAGAGVAFAFSNPPAAPYLTLSRTLSAGGVTVAATAGSETLTLTVTASNTGSATAKASGVHAGKAFHWSGPVNLAGNPQAQLAAVSGYDAAAFTAPFAQAMYFAPACQALADFPTASPPPSGMRSVAHDKTAGGDVVAAVGWGLGAVGGTVLAPIAVAGGLVGAAAMAGIFACGAGAWAVDHWSEDLAAPFDPNAVLQQMQAQQQANDPGLNMPSPVETAGTQGTEGQDNGGDPGGDAGGDGGDGGGGGSPGGPSHDGDPTLKAD
jgi:hypothetical protein